MLMQNPTHLNGYTACVTFPFRTSRLFLSFRLSFSCYHCKQWIHQSEGAVRIRLTFICKILWNSTIFIEWMKNRDVFTHCVLPVTLFLHNVSPFGRPSLLIALHVKVSFSSCHVTAVLFETFFFPTSLCIAWCSTSFQIFQITPQNTNLIYYMFMLGTMAFPRCHCDIVAYKKWLHYKNSRHVIWYDMI